MTGKLGKATNWEQDTVEAIAQEERYSQWGEMDGEILSFDPKTQTATIQPLYRPRIAGQVIDIDPLQEVKVNFPRAGRGALTYPVVEGDKVRLRPSMRSTEKYNTENDGEASDARSFALSDMEAFLDGGESLQTPIKNFDSENVNLRFDEDGKYGLKGSKDGKVRIDGSEGNIYDLLATVVELLASDTLLIKYGSSAGSGHELEHKAQYAEIAAKLKAMAL